MGNFESLAFGVAAFLFFCSMLKWKTTETKMGLIIGVIAGILMGVFSWMFFKNRDAVLLSIFFGGLLTGILSIAIARKIKNKSGEQSRQLGQGLTVGSWAVMMVLKLGFFISGYGSY